MNKQAAHDQMLAVARAEDQIKHEMLQEMDQMKYANWPLKMVIVNGFYLKFFFHLGARSVMDC